MDIELRKMGAYFEVFFSPLRFAEIAPLIQKNLRSNELVVTEFAGDNIKSQSFFRKRIEVPLETVAQERGINLEAYSDVTILGRDDLQEFAGKLSHHALSMFALGDSREPKLFSKLVNKGYHSVDFERLLPNLELAIEWYDDGDGQLITKDIDLVFKLTRAMLLTEMKVVY